jgi:hypothetical protein
VLFLAQLVVLAHTKESMAFNDLPLVIAPVTALFGIFVILNMPLRDPALPDTGISKPFTTPTVSLRTPEDNLTPWQFMCVSWMSPLIRKGMTRHMNDEDIWDLPWEFKHERLHNAFRKLHGSVTSRLLQANGLDLVRTTTLEIIQLLASELPSTQSPDTALMPHSPGHACTAAEGTCVHER